MLVLDGWDVAEALVEAETEAFWRSFLRSLVERGLAGVQLVVSDAHAGLKKAIAQMLGWPLAAFICWDGGWAGCSCPSAPPAGEGLGSVTV